MAKKMRHCLCCGVEYEYCATCNKKDPYWMAEFHNDNCKNIFQICTDFNVELISKEEAKAALEQCDLSNKVNFKSFVQKDLENIFKEESKAKRKHVFEPEITHEVVTEE